MGAARHIFTLHIIKSEHLTPHAKKRVKEKIEKVCLFVQEIANFKVYKRAPDEIFFRKEHDKIFFSEEPEELSSRRTRRIVLREDPKNCPQGGPEEIFLRRNSAKFSSRRNQKNEGGKIFGFINSSFIPIKSIGEVPDDNIEEPNIFGYPITLRKI